MKDLYVMLKGGLGNILFQIACGLSYANKYNKNLKLIKDSNYISIFGSNYFIDKLGENLNLVDNIPIDYDFKFYVENLFNFNEIPFIDSNLCLNGYFQSDKYFNEVRNLILQNLKNINESTLNKYNNLSNGKKTTSIHVRRGDYVNLQEIHPVLPLEYYNNAISEIKNDEMLFFVFSDDIEWCKENFIGDSYIFIEKGDSYEDLMLMSLCNNNIIANSTYSWWGAYLNENENKIVMMPKLNSWFGANVNHNTNDLKCEGWKEILW